jgi:hypothetical protein
MFHHLIAVIALGAGGLEAQEVARGYDTHDQTLYSLQRTEARFGVQFRQPDWRDYVFGSPQEMDDFISDKQRNGWELQIVPRELRVRYRLMQWGGSRIFDNLLEAQAWAAHLERQFGYESRIVESL